MAAGVGSVPQDEGDIVQAVVVTVVSRRSHGRRNSARVLDALRDNRGLSLIAVESEDAARSLAEMIQSPKGVQDDAVTLESVEVREVVANA